jgi:hypothetical protein
MARVASSLCSTHGALRSNFNAFAKVGSTIFRR